MIYSRLLRVLLNVLIVLIVHTLFYLFFKISYEPSFFCHLLAPLAKSWCFIVYLLLTDTNSCERVLLTMNSNSMWHRWDLNLRPASPEADALTTQPLRLIEASCMELDAPYNARVMIATKKHTFASNLL